MMQVFEQLAGYVAQGGFVMPPLIAAAMLLWYALGYRMLTLRRGSALPLADLVKRGYAGQITPPRGIIDQAVLRGVALARERPPHLRSLLDDLFFDLEMDLGRYATLAKAIVVAAPLAGLLGTVAGMIETFDALGEMALFTHSGGIAAGVSQALVSTQTGLAVAIPGLLVGRVLLRKQHLLGDELTKLKHLLCHDRAPGGLPQEVA